MPEEIIKARIVFDTRGIGGGLAGVAGGGGTGLAGAAGAGGVAGTVASVGKIAAGVGIAVGALVAIKASVQKLATVSPRLQATMSIFAKAITLYLRPIADIMSLFLRPLAILMIRYAVDFYRKWKDSKLFQWLAGKTPEEEKTPTMKLAEVITRGAAGEIKKAGAPISPGGLIAIGTIGAIKAMLKVVWDGLKNVGTIIKGWIDLGWDNMTQALDNLFASWGINMDEIRANIAIFLLETLPKWIDDATESIRILWEEKIPLFVENLGKNIGNFFTKTLPEKIEEAWETIKTFFTITVPEWITNAWDGVKTFFTVTIPSWVQGMIDKIRSLFENLSPSNWIRSGIGAVGRYFMDNDVLITKSGDVHQFNPNDNIMAFQGKMPGGKIVVNVNALDASSIDSNTLFKITRAVENAMSRGLGSRTMESTGVGF